MLAETLATVASLVTAGKVREIGLCDEAPAAVRWVMAAAGRGSVCRVGSIQHGYSLLERSFDQHFAPMAAVEYMGLIATAPLAGGLLTGKYIHGGSPTRGGRLERIMRYDGGMLFERRRQTVARYADLASEFGVGLIHMALAFVAARPLIGSVLIGASNIGQLESNLGALHLSLGDELLAAIDSIHAGRLAGDDSSGLRHFVRRHADG